MQLDAAPKEIAAPIRTFGARRTVDSDGSAAETLAPVALPGSVAVAAFCDRDAVNAAAVPDAAVPRVARHADAAAVVPNPTITGAVDCAGELARCTAVVVVAHAGPLGRRREGEGDRRDPAGMGSERAREGARIECLADWGNGRGTN